MLVETDFEEVCDSTVVSEHDRTLLATGPSTDEESESVDEFPLFTSIYCNNYVHQFKTKGIFEEFIERTQDKPTNQMAIS